MAQTKAVVCCVALVTSVIPWFLQPTDSVCMARLGLFVSWVLVLVYFRQRIKHLHDFVKAMKSNDAAAMKSIPTKIHSIEESVKLTVATAGEVLFLVLWSLLAPVQLELTVTDSVLYEVEAKCHGQDQFMVINLTLLGLVCAEMLQRM